MEPTELARMAWEHEALGKDEMVLRLTRRSRVKAGEVRVLPGVMGQVLTVMLVNQAKRGDGYLVTVKVKVADVRSWARKRGFA